MSRRKKKTTTSQDTKKSKNMTNDEVLEQEKEEEVITTSEDESTQVNESVQKDESNDKVLEQEKKEEVITTPEDKSIPENESTQKDKSNNKTNKSNSIINIHEKVLNEYFNRYKNFIKQRKTKEAIQSFFNIYFVVEQHPELFTKAVALFRDNNVLLHEKVALQGIDTYLNKIKIMKLSIFYHVVKCLVRNKDKNKITFNLVRDIIPDKLYQEYIKAIKK